MTRSRPAKSAPLWAKLLLALLSPIVFFGFAELAIRISGIDYELTQNENFEIAIPAWLMADDNFAAGVVPGEKTPSVRVAWLRDFTEARYIGTKLKPNVDVDSLNPFNEIELAKGVTFHFSSNDDGFRSREFGPKDPGVIRIVCIGDSSTFGWGVDDEYTYPQLLEARLGWPRVEVFNLGIPGFTTRHGLGVLRHYALELVRLSQCGLPTCYPEESSSIGSAHGGSSTTRALRMAPLQFELDITPRARLALTDVRGRAAALIGDELDRYPRCFYSSLHTTAGYLPQSLQTRLVGKREGITSYLDVYRALFPERGGYRHDQLGRRTELTAEQRLREPLNGDSHLMFILGRLRACVSYRVRPEPVYFVDLDGMCAGTPRKRTTVLVNYNDEIEVARTSLCVPVSAHPIEAVSLKDPRYGLHEEIRDFIGRHAPGKGRLKLELAPGERHTCLTVNEYETLLMRHDLADVLREPFRFAAEKARHVWNDPRAVPRKARAYARYDLVQALNQLVDVLGLPTSHIERWIARALAVPADRLFGMRRSIDLLISDANPTGRAAIVEGAYQSPILIQWRAATRGARAVNVSLTQFI